MRHGPRGEHAEMPKVRRVCAVAAFEYPNTVHPKMSAESTHFHVGCRVRLVDHNGCLKHHHGKIGVVFIHSGDTVTGRIGVELEDEDDARVFVTPWNISLLGLPPISWEHFKQEKAKEFEDLQQ
jgi:hypothetical protein